MLVDLVPSTLKSLTKDRFAVSKELLDTAELRSTSSTPCFP